MAGQRLMTSGGWASSSRLSSLVIYHICPSAEAGPSLTLSRTGNAIKAASSPAPFTKGSPGGGGTRPSVIPAQVQQVCAALPPAQRWTPLTLQATSERTGSLTAPGWPPVSYSSCHLDTADKTDTVPQGHCPHHPVIIATPAMVIHGKVVLDSSPLNCKSKLQKALKSETFGMPI